MPVRRMLFGLLAAGLLSVPVAAWSAGPPDHPEGPPASTPASPHRPGSAANTNLGAGADDHAAPVRGPGSTGTARAAEASGKAVPAAGRGHGPVHAIEVLQGLLSSGKLPSHAADAVSTALAALQELAQSQP